METRIIPVDLTAELPPDVIAELLADPPTAFGKELLDVMVNLAQYLAVQLHGPAPTLPTDTPARVTVKLTLDQASYLFEKLGDINIARPDPICAVRPPPGQSDPFVMFYRLFMGLSHLRQTTPQASGTGKDVKFLTQGLTLELPTNEATYLLRILSNHKRDTWRKENQEHRLFAPLQVAEIAEEGDEDGPTTKQFLSPSHHENPDAQFQTAVLAEAIAELPQKLRMPPEEVDALLAALTDAEGNVSEAARQLGQPQRKTARRIERILRHLKSRGLSA